jgi:hypothetical protein
MFDMGAWGGLPFGTWAGKGLFEDLTPYLENSGLTLVKSPLNALKSGDRLYRITPTFNITTLVGHADWVEPGGWTFDEMLSALDKLPKGATIVSSKNWSKDDALEFFVWQNMQSFVDWENGKALFDQPDFKQILQFINTIPNVREAGTENSFTGVAEGHQLVELGSFSFPSGYAWIQMTFDNKAVFKGFPNEKRETGIYYPGAFTLSMSAVASDEHKQGVWEFIEFTLNDPSVNEGIPGGYMNQQLFDEQLELLLTTDMTATPKDPFSDSSEMLPGAGPLSKELVNTLLETMDGITSYMETDNTLRSIISEEIQPYFAGQKTLDAVCALIQNRAQLYVGEQK